MDKNAAIVFFGQFMLNVIGSFKCCISTSTINLNNGEKRSKHDFGQFMPNQCLSEMVLVRSIIPFQRQKLT